MTGTLIASISGIRGIFGDGLDPSVLVKYAGAYGTWCRRRAGEHESSTIVVGRDARVTGETCAHIVTATLQSVGCDVLDVGLAPTPTVEMAVLAEEAAGGIILSASHNPADWNALKLLNEKGEALSPEEGDTVLRLAEEDAPAWVGYDALGTYAERDFLDYHIEQILALDFINPEEIAARGFRVVVDGINSVGALALPALLKRLGVREERITLLNGEPTGRFAHPAEPLPGHLAGLMDAVRAHDADLGLAVDPDADRLAFVDDTGTYLSEELTQVVCADFLWRFRSGPFVTNLSSSRAIDDVAACHGETVHRSAVGEINVVKKMQAVDAILGGEGNGGVILPDLHYGRDALAGTALALQYLADEGCSLSTLRERLPRYAIVKDKLPLRDGFDVAALLKATAEAHQGEKLSTVDGLKIDFADGWVHLRPSNTEPILRIYAEAGTEAAAHALADRFKQELREGKGERGKG